MTSRKGKIISVAASAAFALVVLFGCGDNPAGGGNGGSFKTVKIGNQTWMAENLNVKTGNSWCYGNDNANCKKYGRLYDWETALKACPSGWHLHSIEEWYVLLNYAGGDGVRLKSTNGWVTGENGTDEYGFTALPGGEYAIIKNGENEIKFFANVGRFGNWWTSSEDDSIKAIYWHMDNRSNEGAGIREKSHACSVRCLKND